MTKDTPYFTLVSRTHKSEPWAIEFGDYDPECVRDEARDLKYNSDVQGDVFLQTKIIRTKTDRQADIDTALAGLNCRIC